MEAIRDISSLGIRQAAWGLKDACVIVVDLPHVLCIASIQIIHETIDSLLHASSGDKPSGSSFTHYFYYFWLFSLG
jgi:hypothetical protein